MVELYWNIGKRIVEKQEGHSRAKYGESLLIDISKKLTNYFGKGFSEKNLERMRNFYICFPISTTLSSELSWSHYLILIKIKDNDKRNFEKEKENLENYSTQRDLKSVLSTVGHVEKSISILVLQINCQHHGSCINLEKHIKSPTLL